jgi:hypothetical protein
MHNTIALHERKKFFLTGFGVAVTIAVLALVLFSLNLDQAMALLLSVLGVGSMAIAIYVVAASSIPIEASLGVWFVVLLALQHGGGWILEQIFTDQHYSRFFSISEISSAKSLVIVGIGLLAFSSFYTYYISSRRKRGQGYVCASQKRNSTIDQIPWSILLIWWIGFVIIQLAGSVSSVFSSSAVIYITLSVFGYLSVPLVTLLSIKTLASGLKTSTSIAVVLILWLGFVFLTGQRQHIVGISLSTFVLASKWRLTDIRAKHLLLLLSFLLFLMIGMIYLRGIYGRDLFSVALSDKLLILSEERSIDQDRLRSNLQYDLGYRLNAGNILLAQLVDQPDLFWLGPVTYSMAKLIPGFVWTTKAQDVAGELPRLISDHYRLPVVDYIATYITVFYAMGGLPMLILLSSLTGRTIALLDIKSAHNANLLWLILAIGLGGGFLIIDHSINALFLSLRNSLLLYFVIRLSIVVRNARPRR